MIKSIDIENFQSHKETRLDFDPGVNVIIGRSDSGKTAILRALNWAINNKPSGEAFMRHESKETGVRVEFDNGLWIDRSRRGKESTYLRGDVNDGDNADLFKAFGQDVPEEIKKVINFGPLNIQRQMDAPFLLSFTPGEVGRLLNEIVKLDHIDVALKKANRLYRDTGTELKTEEERVEGLIGQGKELSYISDMENDLKGLEELNGRIRGLVEKEQSINSISSAIESIDFDLTDLEWTEDAEEQINNLDKKYQRMVELEKGADSINYLVEAIDDIDLMIERKDKSIKKNEQELKTIMPEVCPICERPML